MTFTDNAQKYEQQAGKQITQISITNHTYSANKANNNRTALANNESASATQPMVASNTAPPPMAESLSTVQAPRINYQLIMTEPNEARAYHRPAQTICIKVQVKPALREGDSISIFLDDNEMSQGLSASIATVDVLPGEHTIGVVIKNKKGQLLKQIYRTVYLIQNTMIVQNKKKTVQQLIAYKQLPWQQKVLLKSRQDDINNPLADKIVS